VDGDPVTDAGDAQLVAEADPVDGDTMGELDGQVDPGIVGSSAQPGSQPGQTMAAVGGAHRSTSTGSTL
jgi:hypothetical protein